MTDLCHDCLMLIPFGWSEQPCTQCSSQVRSAAAATIHPMPFRPAALHDCDTLVAMGWEESACEDCRSKIDLAA